MTTTHTPTPWAMAEATTTIPIRDASGKTVASVKYGETDYAIAAHIVRCVNAHDDLLAALQAMETFVDKLPYRGGIATMLALKQARAALAKAVQS